MSGRVWRRGPIQPLFAATALALLLAGCQTAGTRAPTYTGSIGASSAVIPSDLGPEEALAAVQKWGNAYGRNEKDKVAALNYAAALRGAGQSRQAVAVMRKAAIYHPQDREVLAAFGKALATDGQFKAALDTVRRAQRQDNPDWQLLSTEGGILDSLGQHEEARTLYRQALVLAPGEPQILNNLGLSLALTGDLVQAEAVLQQAAASPRATLKTRQNLAFVQKLKSEGGAPRTPAEIGAAPPQPSPAAAETNSAEQDVWRELASTE